MFFYFILIIKIIVLYTCKSVYKNDTTDKVEKGVCDNLIKNSNGHRIILIIWIVGEWFQQNK